MDRIRQLCMEKMFLHYKKLFNLWRILRDVFRKHHECALHPRTMWRFVKFVAILWRIPIFRHGCALKPKTLWQFVKFVAILRRISIFHHGCALKPKTLWQFVKFVAILRRISIFRHGCALMDIKAQNIALQSGPQHRDVWADSSWSVIKK
jgi:hypothetical protein